jgi:DNA-directed RNA polymerase specialized sigma24 family protein
LTNTGMQDRNASLVEFLAEFPEEFPEEFAAEFAEEFNDRFVRCLRLLHSIAGRVLGGSEGADEAVHNCFVSALRNPPRFESEIAFRAWLLRILIHEAVLLRHERSASATRQETVLKQDSA